ncbi:MAG: YetF domain-containing protein [Pseudomonadota bacterium]
MLFDGWTGILRLLVVGIGAYGVLVVLLRLSGNRTLSKMNAFDFVVTVALGSTLATVLLSKDVALAEGAAAFFLLVFLQMTVTWLSVRWPWFRHLMKSEPKLLVHQGRMLPDALVRERVSPEEIQAAIRTAGHANIEDVAAVVLETDGSFTVLAKTPPPASALANVRGLE